MGISEVFFWNCQCDFGERIDSCLNVMEAQNGIRPSFCILETVPVASNHVQRGPVQSPRPYLRAPESDGVGMASDYSPGSFKADSVNTFEDDALGDMISSEAMQTSSFPDGHENCTEIEDDGEEPELLVGNYILVFVLMTIPNATSSGQVWASLDTNVTVTLSTLENSEESTSWQSRQLVECQQQSCELPTASGELAREICVQIPLDYWHGIEASLEKTYLFEIFLTTYAKKVREFHVVSQWSTVDILCFVQLGRNSQLLHPIQKELRRDQLSDPFSAESIFVGSLTLTGDVIYHHSPSAAEVEKRAKLESGTAFPPPTTGFTQNVIKVDRDEIIAEMNGARAGRPTHKATGLLLMTSAQVKKVLEIRSRWGGLSPRQRRDNVTNDDFYPFLTLNRDETASCLGVCATWLKDAIRSQGMITWPGRPLRRSGAYLQNQKEMLESALARLKYTGKDHPDRPQFESDVQRLKQSISQSLQKRLQIVRDNVFPEYFERYLREGGKIFLNPDWDAIPPYINIDQK